MFQSAELEKKYVHIIIHHMLKDGSENPQDYVFRFMGGHYALKFITSGSRKDKAYRLMNETTKTEINQVKVIGHIYSHDCKKLDDGTPISKQITIKYSSKGEYRLWVSVNKNPE